MVACFPPAAAVIRGGAQLHQQILPPPLHQMLEQGAFVGRDLIVTTVELVGIGHREVPPGRSASALLSNPWRCNRHSLPGANNR